MSPALSSRLSFRTDGMCVSEELNAVNLPQLKGVDLPNCSCDPSFCRGVTLTAGKLQKRNVHILYLFVCVCVVFGRKISLFFFASREFALDW
jgi:hypothetical protein